MVSLVRSVWGPEKKTSSSDLSARAMRISETLLIWGVGALSTHQTTLPRSLTAFGVQLFVAAAGLNGLQEAQLTQFSQSPVSFHVRKLQKITCSCRVWNWQCDSKQQIQLPHVSQAFWIFQSYKNCLQRNAQRSVRAVRNHGEGSWPLSSPGSLVDFAMDSSWGNLCFLQHIFSKNMTSCSNPPINPRVGHLEIMR